MEAEDVSAWQLLYLFVTILRNTSPAPDSIAVLNNLVEAGIDMVRKCESFVSALAGDETDLYLKPHPLEILGYGSRNSMLRWCVRFSVIPTR